MESNGDKSGEAAMQAGELVDEKKIGEDGRQPQSEGGSAESDQANGNEVSVEESLRRETPHPSEPIFGAVHRQVFGGDESE